MSVNVAIIGTQGVPAHYGGFESLVENMLGDNCPSDIKYTVFCSSKDLKQDLTTYKGANLRYIPLRANGIQSIPYDMLSMTHVLRGYDVILVLGTSGCTAMPLLRMLSQARIIVNIDGLEHRRAKWGTLARKVLMASEKMAVRYAHVVIADNDAIADYVRSTYGREAVTIAYGGDHALRQVAPGKVAQTLKDYGVEEGKYAITVCRIEPENNVEMILEAFDKAGSMPLVMIGNWDYSEFGRNLRARYVATPGLKLINAVYDLDTLYALRSSAGLYVHGHSAGGTNPSLVEAMHMAIPIAAFDVSYNRCTTHNAALFFKSADELASIITGGISVPDCGKKLAEIASKHYTWKAISNAYTALFR